MVDDVAGKAGADRVALRWREGQAHRAMTYGELAALTNQIAHVLVDDMGLKPGNRILLRGPNNVMMAASWLASVKAGLVTVATDRKSTRLNSSHYCVSRMSS